jgi:hypothetical protein
VLIWTILRWRLLLKSSPITVLVDDRILSLVAQLYEKVYHPSLKFKTMRRVVVKKVYLTF